MASWASSLDLLRAFSASTEERYLHRCKVLRVVGVHGIKFIVD
jgi:hypothetical protein